MRTPSQTVGPFFAIGLADDLLAGAPLLAQRLCVHVDDSKVLIQKSQAFSHTIEHTSQTRLGLAEGDPAFRQQVELDVQYIESQSVWVDIKLLLKTVPAVLLGKGAY